MLHKLILTQGETCFIFFSIISFGEICPNTPLIHKQHQVQVKIGREEERDLMDQTHIQSHWNIGSKQK